jgi:uncharacterized RDD family membrane protein YckC
MTEQKNNLTEEDRMIMEDMESNEVEDNKLSQSEDLLIRDQMDAETGLHYAGFWMRFWAYLLDLIVIGSISRIIVYPLFRVLDLSVANTGIFSAINIATAAVFYLYFILTTKYFSQTVGKMVFGLKVVSLNEKELSWKTILFREFIGRYLSATIFVLYLLVVFLPKKQGLHDYFADTIVIHERTLAIRKPAYS